MKNVQIEATEVFRRNKKREILFFKKVGAKKRRRPD
jgi:hypothetical protein